MRRNRVIMGSAIGLAAIAAAIDHTRHRLPEPATVQRAPQGAPSALPCGLELEAPCGLGETPCGLEPDAPCGLGGAPCGLGADAPCGLGGDSAPCGL